MAPGQTADNLRNSQPTVRRDLSIRKSFTEAEIPQSPTSDTARPDRPRKYWPQVPAHVSQAMARLLDRADGSWPRPRLAPASSDADAPASMTPACGWVSVWNRISQG